MFSKEKIKKLCKYTLKIKKSFVKNNYNDCTKHCNKLKNIIGGHSQDIKTNIDDIFELLLNYIVDIQQKLSTLKVDNDLIETNNKKTMENIENTHEQIKFLENDIKEIKENNTLQETTNNELITKINLQNKTVKTNDDLIEELKKLNADLKNKNQKYQEKKTKYNEIISLINEKITGVKNSSNDQDNLIKLNEILDTINEKLTSNEKNNNSNDKLIKKTDNEIICLNSSNEKLLKQISELEKEHEQKKILKSTQLIKKNLIK